ncbi:MULTISPECIES: helix-turn-helix domain-containing protein [Mesorhizobium]|uniref:XRE family transcriptional regulator n=1 Tax=Mesorhizobium denitrificans TaxID=2294114 RepID=A0A371XFP4_9HYPH|nr:MULTISPECIES: helix-turn-helix transcriptional regulator [Mesorhizobium]RFC68056.1 XRE family transcriptional regulator [Mesorhizobium denitrificans]
MDKRDVSALFRERLKALLLRSGLNQSTFAGTIGIDRSALSQILSGATTRLPRAETLMTIADRHKVSLDWLLGLSQDEVVTGEIRDMMEIEEGVSGYGESFMARWYAEAAGMKVRYVPAGIPDLLRTQELVDYEAGISHRDAEAQANEARNRIDYNRRPETDMEACMPRHTLEIFARGRGIWSGFPAAQRRRQLLHMATLLEELYPAFRLILYDGRQRYSVPYTIFGSLRAAIYVGDMYLVLNAPTPISMLTRHFDNLIRAAVVHAHDTASYARNLASMVVDET